MKQRIFGLSAAAAVMTAVSVILAECSLAQSENISPDGTASQSSEWNNGQFPAANAIDGDTGTFSHTDSNSRDNHWVLTFESEREMSRIEIVAREDCCGGRLSNTTLRIFDDDGESVFDAEVPDPGQGGTAEFELPLMTFGKSVRVGFEDGARNNQGNRNLHLGEVRVFGFDTASALIESFSASRGEISGGEFVELSWVVQADQIEIAGIGSFPPEGSTTVRPTLSTVYTLIATDGATTESASISVIVDGIKLEPFISEFMAAPVGDAVLQGADWIEISNPNSTAFGLDGFALTDDPTDATGWKFPEGTSIPANGFLLVKASGTVEVSNEEDILVAPFRLGRSEGEYLALLTANGRAISVYRYPRQVSGISFGLDALGKERFFSSPTPGAPNRFGFEGVVSDTKFSVDRGFFGEPFDLEITTSTEDATILITLDGTLPNRENPVAQVYAAAMRIDHTAIVRAAAFRNGYLPSNADTQTYLFVADVIAQPDQPDGFPTDWGRGPGVQSRLPARFDYEMDPRIVGRAPFTDLSGEDFGWEEALTSIPTMSIVMDIDGLLDPQDGLHARAQNRGRAWEREASLEIIDPQSETSAQVNCGIRMQGGWNRFPEMLKKAMRLYFRGEYGDSKLRFPLFPGSDVEEFDRIVLRSGNGKAWPSPWRALSGGGNSLPRTTYLRDQFVRDTQRDLGHPIANGTFVHLYVNGLYWGLYNPLERLDEKYAQAHFGGQESDYDVVKWIRGRGGLQLVSGTIAPWTELIRRVRRSQATAENWGVQNDRRMGVCGSCNI
jgi:hypothetical protein